MARATPQPISASKKRVKVKPVGTWMVATSTAEVAAWVTARPLPPRTIATSMASATTSASCQAPEPRAMMIASPTPIPSATPKLSSTARRVRCP